MSGPDFPPTPPPEVPEEFADAYQAAYERALAEQKVAGGRHRVHLHGQEPPGAHADWDAADWTEYGVPSPFETFRSSRWFVPALLVLAAVLLVLAAYGVGRIFADGVSDAGPVTGQQSTGQHQKLVVREGPRDATCVSAVRVVAAGA